VLRASTVDAACAHVQHRAREIGGEHDVAAAAQHEQGRGAVRRSIGQFGQVRGVVDGLQTGCAGRQVQRVEVAQVGVELCRLDHGALR
jgi:hypothetical protein